MTFKICRNNNDGNPEILVGRPFATLDECKDSLDLILKELLTLNRTLHGGKAPVRGDEPVVLQLAGQQNLSPYFFVRHSAAYNLRIVCDDTDGVPQSKIDANLVELADSHKILKETDE